MKSTGANAETREAKALEAGGKAVVRHLLEGKDSAWKNAYAQMTVFNINNNLQFFKNDGRENKPGYEGRRSAIYLNEGYIGPKINFIPDEYLGPDAAQKIDECIRTMGFKFSAVPAATPPSTSGKSPFSIRKQPRF